MTSTILYVSVDGNDLTATPGTPTQPYTLLGAINQLNQQPAGSPPITLMLANGIYNLPCEPGVTLVNNVNIIGTGPRNSVLSSVNLTIAAGVTTVTMTSLSLTSCTRGFLNMLSVYGGILTLNNCEITVTNGTFLNLNNGVVSLNTCNVTISSGQNPLINASNGGLIATNSNIIATISGPLSSNIAIIGLSPGTGFADLTSITLVVNLNGGSYTVIPYYNVNIVTSATTVVKGTGTESLILIGVDLQPQTPNPNTPTPLGSTQKPLYGVNLTTTARNLAAAYSDFNLNNYPLVLTNLQWPGLTTMPGPYNPTALQTTQLPPPITTGTIPQTPVITGPSGQPMMGPSGQPITAPSGTATPNLTSQPINPNLPSGIRGPNQGPSNQGPSNQGPSNQGPSNQGPSNQGFPGGPSQYPSSEGFQQPGFRPYPPIPPGLGGLGFGGCGGPVLGGPRINPELGPEPRIGFVPPIETYDPNWDQVPGSDNLPEDIFAA